MSKKGTKALASATLLSLVLTTALSAGPVKADASNVVTRTSGADRYATAAAVATKDGKTNDNVVLVCGEGYADAVSGSVLAKTIDAPILLTQSKTLSADTKTALDALKPKNIYVIGGTASIAQSVRDGLKSSGYNLIELGGANRYETNVKVANELVKNHGVKADNVMVVGGEGFSDALSVAPVAAAKGQILLLGSNSQSDMQSVIDFVNTNKSKATVVGTSYVMNDSILKALGVDPSARINGGADRFATNINVLNAFKSDLKNGDIYVANATADDGYADALVASALAGKSASPLVLVDKDGTDATTNALNYIKGEMSSSSKIDVVGGTGVVSDSLFSQIQNLSPVTPVDDNTVKSVEPVGLNQVKVTFNSDVDEDSAQDVTNYKIDNTALTDDDSDNGASAELQDDNRTVLINLSKSRDQQKAYTISVKNGVLTKDKTKSIEAKDQSVTFSDTAEPTLGTVTPKGNSKITVTFSEPIKVPIVSGQSYNSDGEYIPDTAFTSKFKINGQNITSFGLSTTETPTTASTKTKHAALATTGQAFVWADKVDFYFTGKLSTGSNTLEVVQGDSQSNVLSDAAGFVVKDQSQTFNVDSVSTKPQVKSVNADPDGTIWVRFDRPMSKNACDPGNYGLNTSSNTAGNLKNDLTYNAHQGSLKEGDCTVKFKDVLNLPYGSNSLYLSTSIKDAYGNTIDDDTRPQFTMTKDETKPTVEDVSMIDNDTIRVRFSKDVKKADAANTANYVLKDSSGVDISKHIRIVKPANKSVPDDDAYNTSTSKDTDMCFDNWDNGDNVWDVKIYKTANDGSGDDWKLTGSKYTLTMKNISDTTKSANLLDEVTKELNGSDTEAPKMNNTGYYSVATDSNNKRYKVVLFFSEAMDSSTLSDSGNYQFENGSGDSKQLPSGTTITPGNDDKSVTLELPEGYTPKNATLLGGATRSDDNTVVTINASNLKDQAGNVLSTFYNKAVLADASTDTTHATYKDSTYRLVYNGDDLEVRFQYNKSIDPDTIKDAFQVAGQDPDSATIEGSDVVLTFNKGTKATTTDQAIKNDNYTDNPGLIAAAPGEIPAIDSNLTKIEAIKLAAKDSDTNVKYAPIKLKYPGDVTKVPTDIAGVPVTTTSALGTGVVVQNVYTNEAQPKTTSDYWFATKPSTSGTTTSAAVVLTFDSALYDGSGVLTDDYTFKSPSGATITADKVVIRGNSLIFEFIAKDDNDRATLINKVFDKVNQKTIGVALKNKGINVSARKDNNGSDDGKYAKYVPSDSDGSDTRDVNITDTIDFNTLNSHLGL